MKNDQPVSIYRKDYKSFDFNLKSINLNFELKDEQTTVTSKAHYVRKASSQKTEIPLFLYGEQLELVSLNINGKTVAADGYLLDSTSLTINSVPDEFLLEIVTVIYPDKNSSLEGLYRSSGNYCTQCEAEGFRKITYYPDRPDVLSKFTTRIEADRDSCPVMLSNGNLIESGELQENRHFAIWQDPFPKPSYLFALVAGRLVSIEDEFVTKSGKNIDLKIFVEERNREKCDHAMVSLKKSMRWDEEVFGLEYDLNNYMVVAVDDFNMGAMENKGLNVFNSKYVLTTRESATDQDYLGVEGVIAHEYFHNWTGNRVTCRDWFQLSLKEGLTVFRDQEFSSDMNSRPVQRIDDVRLLKNFQFKEDASPMAHPIRPDSFLEINNFYTATVYNKGAEVIRMMHTLIGAEAFRKGMDLYFKRHDGQAVTCDDFVAAISDGSGVNLEQFKNWYSQAGTPVLTVKTEWLAGSSKYKIVINQSCPDTPGQSQKLPFHMPITVGLLGAEGKSLLETDSDDNSVVLQLCEKEQLFVFEDIKELPVLSFLRDFSAPVRVKQFQSREELALLAANDPNLFNRWDSMNRLSSEIVLEVVKQLRLKKPVVIDDIYLEAVSKSISAATSDPALLALSLQLPSEATLAQEMDQIHPSSLHRAKKLVKKAISERNRIRFQELYQQNKESGKHSLEPVAMAKRSLKNVCLGYLAALDPLPEEVLEICQEQYITAENMTDAVAALTHLINIGGEVRDRAVDHFYKKWSDDPLVLDKWFALQAMSNLPETLDKVIQLMGHPAFSISNPNKVRSLIGSFCSGNHNLFHCKDGKGYRFLADRILELNNINPQIAARLVTPLISWKRYEPIRGALMKDELERILTKKTLSRDVFEIVSKSLKPQP
ncbi:MAG: aminopeptidase N [Proteobacteria bacterium]|nr:aminopeptidase N [Pseudomonadota bacterium]